VQSTRKIAAAHTGSVDMVPFVVAALVLAVAVGLLVLRSAPASPHHPATATSPPASVPASAVHNGLFELNARTHEVINPAAYQTFVPGAVLGFGSRWTASRDGVVHIGAAGTAIDWVVVPGGAESVVAAGYDVWATSRRDHSAVYRVDPVSQTQPTRLAVPGRLSGRLFSGVGFLWAPTSTSLLQLDPATGRVVAHYPIAPGQPGHNANVMAFGAGSAWVVDEHSGELDVSRPGVLYRIDPLTRTIMARIPMPALNWYDEFELAYGGGLLWVCDDHSGVLRAVSPDTDAVVHAREVGVVDSMAVGDRSVWLVGPAHGLTQLGYDARPIWRSEVPGSPRTIGINGPSLWVSYHAAA
jgi:hypothetical protein